MSTDKAALRQRFLQHRAAERAQTRAEISDKITRHVLALDVYRAARTVFVYVATPEEIETRALIADALAQGKAVCVPCCEADGTMTARAIETLSALKPSRFGLLEPSAQAPTVPPAKIDLILAPALACDIEGYRLGYGGGYYDRFLQQTTAPCAALCAHARLVDALPHETHDAVCQLIITERQVLRLYEK